MVNLFKNKKGAAEVFNLVVPMIVFILVCIIVMILFYFVKGYFSRTDILAHSNEIHIPYEVIDTNYIALPTLLSSEIKHNTKNYNLSLYEIIYYRLENEYKDKIIGSIISSIGKNTYLIVYKGENCVRDFDFMSIEKFIPTSVDYTIPLIDELEINGRCVQLRNYYWDPDTMAYVAG